MTSPFIVDPSMMSSSSTASTSTMLDPNNALSSALSAQPALLMMVPPLVNAVPEPTFPPIAEACFQALSTEDSLRMPGLFTEGDDGMDEKALSLLEQFDRGKSPPLQSRSPLLVALLLKRWLATLDFAIFGAVAGDLLIQAHLRPTPQQTLEQFRNIVSALQPVPFHLLRRLTATLRAYFREHEKTGGVQLQALGDMFAPLVMWMPIRDPMRVRPTNEQLGGVPPGHVLVQINIPPLGFTTRQPLPLNVTVSRLRAQMLTAAGATSMFGWHMWLAPPSPQLLDPSCTLRQYNVQNTDILVINNEDQCDKPVYFAAASSIIRCAIKNHPVFFPSASETLSPRSSAGAPPLQRRSSMAPTMNGGAAGGGGGVGGGGGASPFDTMPVNGGGAAPMLQRRSTVAAIGGGGEPVTTYMAPSLEIFKNDSTRLSSSPGSPAVGPGRPGPAKPPSLRNSTQQRTSVDLQLPPSTTAVPSPFVSSGDIAAPVPAPGVRREGSGGLGTPPASSMFAGGNPNSSPQQPQQQQFVGAGSPATGAMSPGLARRDLANRPRAQTPLVLDPVRALPPVASPAANKRGPAPGRKASPSKPIVRDAYQPLADARRRGTLLGASGSSDNADDADQNNDDDPTAETQYQDIPTKWAPEMAKEGGAALSPRSLPVMPAGVRRSEEVTHYGSSKMLQQGVAGVVPKAGAGRPSFDIRDDKAPF